MNDSVGFLKEGVSDSDSNNRLYNKDDEYSKKKNRMKNKLIF